MTVQSFDRIREFAFSKLSMLDANLTYHCPDHTRDVIRQSVRIAQEEGIEDGRQLNLLKIASLYHDIGFLQTYLKHEEKSVEIFLADAGSFLLTDQDQEEVVKLIMVTKIPQSPVTILEKIICDADLDYLGRDDFFPISESLRKEFLAYQIVADDAQWFALQMNFLRNHHYHTKSSQRLREPVKQQNYSLLLAKESQI